MSERFAGDEIQGHGYFLARKFLVLGPVALARSFHLIACFAFIVFLFPLSTHAYTSPGSPQGYVNDFAGVLSVGDKQTIESELQSLKQSTGDEVAVVTIKSLGDETIETYAVKLFQEWGIGSKDKDNGLLILVAPNDRKVRIEVGYGLEGTVTDLQSGIIISKVMIPAFKNNDFAGGIKGGVDAVSAIITGSPEAAQYSQAPSSNYSDGFANVLPFFFFIFIFLVNIFARVLGRTKSWWLGGVLGGIVGIIIGFAVQSLIAGLIAAPILIGLGLLFDYIVSKHPPGSGGKGGGFWPIFFGGGRGGSGGGGFGGFGGGGSGGGGASGGW